MFPVILLGIPPPPLSHTHEHVGWGGDKNSLTCLHEHTDNTHERLHIQPQDKKSDFGILSDVVHLFLTNINAFQFVNVVVAHRSMTK